ncbi:MAG: hypothetical protein IH948_06150, partial [Bacteroidetes bacterium]|nr:hypothetical protein [Bacteroidota bacterium]
MAEEKTGLNEGQIKEVQNIFQGEIGKLLRTNEGGTNQNSYTKGDLLAAAGVNVLNKLPVGS